MTRTQLSSPAIPLAPAPRAGAVRRATLSLAALAVSLSIGAFAPAQAFDGDRRGFLIGLAGGLHTSSGDENGNGFDDFDDSVTGLSLRVMVGGGLSENFTVYGTRDVNIDSDDVAFGLTGVGGHFYFGGNGPGPFLLGAIGVGDVAFEEADRLDDDDDYDDYDVAIGFGAMFGGGYAFTQGFHLDGSVMVVDVTDDDNFARDVDYTYVSVRAMLGYTWF